MRQYGSWIVITTLDSSYLRIDGTNSMLADLNMNEHNINNALAISNTTGPSQFSITLGPSLDLASDSTINLIASSGVVINSSNLDLNGNSIIGVDQLVGQSSLTLRDVTNMTYIDMDGTSINFNGQMNINNQPMIAVDSISGNGAITINPTNELIINNTLMMQGFNIVKLAYPVNGDDAATKTSVDDAINTNNSTLSVFSLNNVIPNPSPQNG